MISHELWMGALPVDTVRGRIRDYLWRQAHIVKPPVLELGSRLPSARCWWANNRGLCRGEWVGVDQSEGANVDLVCDVHALPFEASRFRTVICSEVLEHVEDPQRVLHSAWRVLASGGAIVVTTLFAFQYHGYPDDYWRFSEHGLGLLLRRAGFREVTTESSGLIEAWMDNDGTPGGGKLRQMPIHTFATARA